MTRESLKNRAARDRHANDNRGSDSNRSDRDISFKPRYFPRGTGQESVKKARPNHGDAAFSGGQPRNARVTVMHADKVILMIVLCAVSDNPIYV